MEVLRERGDGRGLGANGAQRDEADNGGNGLKVVHLR